MAHESDLEQMLKALANGNRLKIVKYLDGHPSATLGELAEILDISQAATSDHVRWLRNVGVVTPIRRGMYTSFRLPLKRDALLREVLRRV